MPSYDYDCEKCDLTATFVRSMTEGPKDELCVMCGNPMRRVFSIPYVTGAKVEHAEYNPAFGKVIKNSRERGELAKRKGWVEVGTEPTDKLHKSAENTLNQKLKKSWEDV